MFKMQNELVVCVLLLVNYSEGGFSWHKVSEAFKKAGDDIVGEARRFGDRLAPDVEHVRDEIDRLGQRIQPGIENVRDFITGNSKPSDSNPNAGQALSLPDPAPETTHCPAIVEPSLHLECHLEGVVVNCSQPMAVDTVVQIKCHEAYVFLEYPGYNSVKCNSTFFWNRPIIKCVPDCGKRNNLGGRQLVSNGERAQVSEFSWHVGVYKLNRTALYAQVCGATLVTTSLVISAAHCFWDHKINKALPISSFKLAAGKYHRDWYIEDTETQKRDLAELHIHERFNGMRRNLAYDIAVVKVTQEFKLTWAINVICMDYPKAYEDIHLTPGNNGTVAGWGVTENNTQSDVLMSVQLPYVDYLQCGDLVDVQFQKFLTDDKICGGFVGRSTSVCPGDSGGGYVFPHQKEQGLRYYLRGVVSAGHVPYELWRLCENQQLAAFTLVSKHRAFLERLVLRRFTDDFSLT